MNRSGFFGYNGLVKKNVIPLFEGMISTSLLSNGDNWYE